MLQGLKKSALTGDTRIAQLFVTVTANTDATANFAKVSTSKKTFTVAEASGTVTLGDTDKATVTLADLAIGIDPNATMTSTVADTAHGYLAANDTIVIKNGTATKTYKIAIA